MGLLGSILGLLSRRRGRISREVAPGSTPYRKGDRIGAEYEVYDVLGEGGFGIVYLAYSRKTSSVVALKTLVYCLVLFSVSIIWII